MNRDLIFHIVSKRKWREANKDGVYRPFEENSEEKIEFIWPEHLNRYLNQNYKGRKNLFILVVDVNRLPFGLINQRESEVVKAGHEIYSEAILDKIRINCGSDGNFDLDVTSK